MKYGRYLKDHEIGEWERAYINYGVLKKLISAAVASRASTLLQSQHSQFIGSGSQHASPSGMSNPRTPRERQTPGKKGDGDPDKDSLVDDEFRLPNAAMPMTAAGSGSKLPVPGDQGDDEADHLSAHGASGRRLRPPEDTKGKTKIHRDHARGMFTTASSSQSASVEQLQDPEVAEEDAKAKPDASDDSTTPLSPSLAAGGKPPSSGPLPIPMSPASSLKGRYNTEGGNSPGGLRKKSPRFTGIVSRSNRELERDLGDVAEDEGGDDSDSEGGDEGKLREGETPMSPKSQRSQRSGKSSLRIQSPRSLVQGWMSPRKSTKSGDESVDLNNAEEGSGSGGKRKSPRLSLSRRKSSSSMTSLTRAKWRFNPDTPLPQIYPHLNEAEMAFFHKLDLELEKIKDFYDEREEEARRRFDILERQLEELAQHRKEHKEQHHHQSFSFATAAGAADGRGRVMNKLTGALDGSHKKRERSQERAPVATGKQDPDAAKKDFVKRPAPGFTPDSDAELEVDGATAANGPRTAGPIAPTVSAMSTLRNRKVPHFHLPARVEAYGVARSQLKLACFEFYRYLNMLQSYRTMNRTGFSKVLKKMEKRTRIPCSPWYLENKVNPSHFVTSNKIDELGRAIEDVFARFFEGGNRKKALERLRVMGRQKTHHQSAWRSGVMMGLAIPVLVDGIVKSFHPQTRAEIPYWPALLQLFAAELVPTLFACLFATNLIAYRRARINYVLIFEFDLRSVQDFRTFVELPAFLFLLLCYCFWLAFSNFWPNHISPKAWPMVWLVITIIIMLDPLPIMHPKSRFWMIKSLARVTTAGLLRVEFRDFFLGDQLTSVYYALYNIGFLVCVYHRNWEGVPPACSTNETWASPILAALPNFWRFGQSLRRFVDSDGNQIHLYNASKYAAGILYLFFYFNWRIYGSHLDYSFALFIVFGTINALATSTWDILMDWNLGNRNAKHFLLRDQIMYSDQVWFYYFAMITDPLLRFAWVMYIPDPKAGWRHSPSVQLRGWVVTMCEILRRWQWNFLRLCSEQCGNQDAYRVTRDVPLPYALPDHHKDDGSGSDREGEEPEKVVTRLKALWSRQSDPTDGKGRRLGEVSKALGGVDATEEAVASGFRQKWQTFKDEVRGKHRGMDSSDENSADEQGYTGARKPAGRPPAQILEGEDGREVRKRADEVAV